MFIETKNNGLIKVLAEKGKKITNSERTFFSDFIYLGINDSAENYEEVDRDVWKYFIEEENPDIIELIERNKELQETIYMLQDLLLDTDFRLMVLEMEKEYGEM